MFDTSLSVSPWHLIRPGVTICCFCASAVVSFTMVLEKQSEKTNNNFNDMEMHCIQCYGPLGSSSLINAFLSWLCTWQNIIAGNKEYLLRLQVLQVTAVFGSFRQLNYRSTEVFGDDTQVCVSHVSSSGACSTPGFLSHSEQPFRAEMISRLIHNEGCGVCPKVSLL